MQGDMMDAADFELLITNPQAWVARRERLRALELRALRRMIIGREIALFVIFLLTLVCMMAGALLLKYRHADATLAFVCIWVSGVLGMFYCFCIAGRKRYL